MKKVRARGKNYDVPVEKFIENYIAVGQDDFYNRSDKIEDKIERLAEVFGNLVSVLSSKGILSDAEVLEMVSSYGCEIVSVDDD